MKSFILSFVGIFAFLVACSSSKETSSGGASSGAPACNAGDQCAQDCESTCTQIGGYQCLPPNVDCKKACEGASGATRSNFIGCFNGKKGEDGGLSACGIRDCYFILVPNDKDKPTEQDLSRCNSTCEKMSPGESGCADQALWQACLTKCKSATTTQIDKLVSCVDGTFPNCDTAKPCLADFTK